MTSNLASTPGQTWSSYRPSYSPATDPVSIPGPVDDFASFMMLFHDIFLRDEFYSDFGMTDDLQTSNVIGMGAQFEVKLLALRGQMALRTSSEASSRLTDGKVVALKRPLLDVNEHGHFMEQVPIGNIVNELRVITHPQLRHDPNILDVYGFAWEREDQVPGVDVWPIIMEEYGCFGTMDECLAQMTPLDLATKLRLMGNVAAGVQGLHDCGICHSDLKPNNILVCETIDGDMVAKLADFGLSIFVDDRPSLSTWSSGSSLWTVPEWGSQCRNTTVLAADIYSCGLLLWTALLDGQSPWELDVFGGSKEEFQRAKTDPAAFLDIALATAQKVVPLSRREEITRLLSSLLCPEEARDLSLLLRYSSNQLEENSTVVAPQNNRPTQRRHRQQVGDRPSFLSFNDIETAPLPVKAQIFNSLATIATNPDKPRERRADSCYSLAMFHVLRIGTVRPVAPESEEYTGYDIDWKAVLKWLKMAAELGSPSAQAVYYPFSQAATQVYAIALEDTERVSQSTIITWLENATRLGSHIAGHHLRKLDRGAYQRALLALHTEYCGVGRTLYTDNVSSQQLNEFNDTELHIASVRGEYDEVVRICSGPGVDVNVTNSRGETPLLLACRSGHANIARHLLKLGADASLVNCNGENALHWLGEFDDLEPDDLFDLAHTLVGHGADIEQDCEVNDVFNQHFAMALGFGTPLCRAVARNALPAARVLLQLGANPYKHIERNGSFTLTSAMASACQRHHKPFIQLFLDETNSFEPYVPSWRGDPVPLVPDMKSAFEILKVKVTKPPTMQSAAPHAWKKSEGKFGEESLLGSAVAPLPLHTRIGLHGAAYISQMKESIDAIAAMPTETFGRVTYDLHTAIFHSVLSRDLSIVQHLLTTYPDETIPALTNPLPNARPGPRPTAHILLTHAPPTSPVGVSTIEGLNDTPETQAVSRKIGQWFRKETTLAEARVSTQFRNIVNLAAASHPDPYFLNLILDALPPSTAHGLVNAHNSPHDDLPLMAAVTRHFYALALSLLRHGASVDEMAHSTGPGMGIKMSMTTLGALIAFNNHSSHAAARWLLTNAHSPSPSPVVTSFGHSVFDLAVSAGSVYETGGGGLFPVRLYHFNPRMLKMLLSHYPAEQVHELINRRDESQTFTPLHQAIFKLRPEAVDALLDHGAETDIPLGGQVNDGRRRRLVKKVTGFLQKGMLSILAGIPMETLKFNERILESGLTARELAQGMLADEGIIPDAVRQRGRKEVEKYLQRMEEVRRRLI
ncbi:hypothetical protein V8F20_012715 [Naviculisporaceae sp. PSN 640]